MEVILMNLIDELKCNSTILNTKGSKYYVSTYNSNLDVFTMLTRYASESEIIRLFNNALNENTILALSNLLYILDIRNGKGERRLFKIIFKYLCLNHKDLALQVLPYISKLGRYDYILVGLDTPINNEVISLIKVHLQTNENPRNKSKNQKKKSKQKTFLKMLRLKAFQHHQMSVSNLLTATHILALTTECKT